MGDRVAVMKDGVLQQVDTPLSLYDTPENLFVAGFIGSPAMNLMQGAVVEGGVKLGDYTVPVARETLQKAKDEKTLTLGIRPETFSVADDDQGIPVEVELVEELGADSFLYGVIAGLPEEEKLDAPQIVARIKARHTPKRNSEVRLAIDPAHVHVFSDESLARLS